MIIRVRTNVGASRLDVDPTCTLTQLIALIIKTLNIQRPTVTLASDLAGVITYSQSNLKLSELGIKQGTEVFVIGKFEKRVVEKSYINDEGEVVPAGQTLVQIDVEDVSQTEPAARNISESIQSGEKATPEATDKKEFDAAVVANTNNNNQGNTNANNSEPADIPFNYEAYSQAYNYEDANDGVRAPDEARKMTLLGDGDATSTYSNPGSDVHGHYDIGTTAAGRSLMHAVLSPEDQAQIDELERSLRELGLQEYEVLQETQNLQDELIARRLQRESARDARAMAAADLLRTPDLLASMQDLDATLARYHAAQQPQPAVLRLQQYQQGHHRGAIKNNSDNTSNIKADGGAGHTALRTTGQKAAVQSKDRDSGPAIATDRSTSQHSDITQSSASSVNNTHTKSAASSVKSSTKGRQPSKAYTDAVRQLEDVAHDFGELASTTHARLSALQQGALRTLTAPLPAPASTSAVLNTTRTTPASARTPARTMNVDTTAAGTERAMIGINGSSKSLLHTLSPTSTLSRSIASPPRPGVNARSTFAPLAAYTAEEAAGLADYEMDEDALLTLLSQEIQPTNSNKSTSHKGAVHNDAPNSKQGAEGLGQPAPTVRCPSQPTSMAETRPTRLQEKSTPAPTVAPSLVESGYKSMAQIKAEKLNQINVRIGHTGRAASMPNVKTPISITNRVARSESTASNGGARAAAPYSMQARRGILQAEDGAGGRTGGVATTVVAHNERHNPRTGDAGMYMDEGMDDSLALALQLSLEDSQQQQAQLRHNQADSTSTPQSALHQKTAKVPPTRARVPKKATADAKISDVSALSSTLLPSSKRPIAVLLPSTGARGGAAGAASGTARSAVERSNSDAADRESAAVRRLTQERIQQERHLQEQLDAETAAEMMRQEEADELAAREYQRALDREAETSLLREHLHGHNINHRNPGLGPAADLPAWLDRTVNDFANDALLNMAENRSFNAQPYGPAAGVQLRQQPPPQRQPAPAVVVQQRAPARPQRPYMEPERAAVYGTYNYGDANYMNVEYDQDDEVLAQAIQNSLNDVYY